MRWSSASRLDTAKVHYKLVKKDLSSAVTRDLLFWDRSGDLGLAESFGTSLEWSAAAA